MSRKSPEQSAAATKIGTVKTGLDGNKWKVQTIANGTRRWVVQSKTVKAGKDVKGKSYLTLDNGGHAFLVTYDKTEFVIHAPDTKALQKVYDMMTSDNQRKGFFDFFSNKSSKVAIRRKRELKECFTKQVYRSKHAKVFVGKSAEKFANGKEYDGNSMLFELTNGSYVCVSNDIISFRPLAKITTFKSPVLGSNVPYPYAIDGIYSYSMIARHCVPLREMDDPKAEPSDIIYQIGVTPKNKKKFQKLPQLKVIRKRGI